MSPRPRDDRYRPFRPVGQKLGYADAVDPKATGNPNAPTATPYLVVPAVPADAGTRPLTGTAALHSQAIQIVDPNGTVVASPVAGTTYRLRATVRNRGATGAYAGLAAFYIGSPPVFDAWASGSGGAAPAPVPLARTGFTARGSAAVTVESPSTWTPKNADEAAMGVLVQAYDLVLDPLGRPFDARGNRHVGRRDFVPDFAGIWSGTEAQSGTTTSNTLKIVAKQEGLRVNCDFYPADPAPVNPKSSGAGSIAANAVSIASTEYVAPGFIRNEWTLTLPDPDTLGVDRVETYWSTPQYKVWTQHWTATLKRV
jgi:hypothetical protein